MPRNQKIFKISITFLLENFEFSFLNVSFILGIQKSNLYNKLNLYPIE